MLVQAVKNEEAFNFAHDEYVGSSDHAMEQHWSLTH
jgi:hypothetical protein